MSDSPLITKDFLKFVMTDAMPGCRLKTNERMGGVIMSMAVWHYELSISLNQRGVSISDVIGEALMTLTYLPKELQADKPAKVIILRRVATVDPDRVKQFVKGVRRYMKSIVQAINVATDDPCKKEANIFTDGFDDE